MLRPIASLSAVLLCLALIASAQAPAKATPVLKLAATALPTPQEQRAIRAFAAAKQSPLQLNAFLFKMPKGADLHMHLTGAIYAETFIKNAAADILCVNPKNYSLFKPSATTRSIPPQPICGEDNRRASDAFKDQTLYDALVDSFSMRSFVPSAGTSGHNHFFSTFGRFSGIEFRASRVRAACSGCSSSSSDKYSWDGTERHNPKICHIWDLTNKYNLAREGDLLNQVQVATVT